MRVLLVNPPPRQHVDEYDTPNFTRLGLVSLAAMVRHARVGEVAVVDAKFERLDAAGILERVRRFRPDVVGLTAFTNEIKPASEIAARIKTTSPSIVTVVGGVHASALPARTLDEMPAFDHLVAGEGEHAFVALLGALGAGEPPRGPGLWSRDEAGVPRPCGGAASAPPPRLDGDDALPPPAWDLVPASPRALVMTQRGCPYACTFCANPNGRSVRQRSVEAVVEELRFLAARGTRELYVCDEIFTVDRERTHRLLDAIIAAGLPRTLRWSAQTHVNTVDRALFSKMKAAGCHVCGLGIETGDPDAMRAMRKGSTRERVLEARRAARAAGLPIEGLFILGHPHETWASTMRTIDFAVELNPERPIVGVMVPYPGTRVAELAARGEGGYRLRSTDWDDYNKQIGNALELEHLGRRELELLQMLAYVRVFAENRRFADLARFAWRYRSEGLAVVRKIASGRMPRPAARGSRSPSPAPRAARRLPIVPPP